MFHALLCCRRTRRLLVRQPSPEVCDVRPSSYADGDAEAVPAVRGKELFEEGEVVTSIWVVENGEYSDYRVEGVFSTKENANLAAEFTGGEVAQWPLDPAIDELRQGRKVFRVDMAKDGTVKNCSPEAVLIEDLPPYELIHYFDLSSQRAKNDYPVR